MMPAAEIRLEIRIDPSKCDPSKKLVTESSRIEDFSLTKTPLRGVPPAEPRFLTFIFSTGMAMGSRAPCVLLKRAVYITRASENWAMLGPARSQQACHRCFSPFAALPSSTSASRWTCGHEG